MSIPATISCVFLLSGVLSVAAQERVPLSSLDLGKLRQGWGRPKIDRSIEDRPLSIGGRSFERGIGSHASSLLHLRLAGGTERFASWVGVDDETEGRGSVVFRVYADGRKRFDSGVMRGGDGPLRIDLVLEGVQMLTLVTTDAGDGNHYDHADWAEAELHATGVAPEAADAPTEPKVLLTPPPGPGPRLNGPLVYGARPGRPIIHRIPCTGTRPMVFSADDLPDSLALDPETGILTGTAPARAGRYLLALHAGNEHGAAERPFEIVVGDTLALTPPMGWNSWYIHYDRSPRPTCALPPTP